jgi:hypothetical protein
MDLPPKSFQVQDFIKRILVRKVYQQGQDGAFQRDFPTNRPVLYYDYQSLSARIAVIVLSIAV